MDYSEPCACGAREGKLHRINCAQEECPFCHQQLLGCDCIYIILKIDPEKEPVFSNGPNGKQELQWRKVVREKGRIPYGQEIRYKALDAWTINDRMRAIATICNENAQAAKKQKALPGKKVSELLNRIAGIITKNNVFLEMNREHFMSGARLTWKPPA